ncbi:AI-2E family transporter [Halorientalis brevis]|uniref:AI-2E family transporter n=1 Tax=Halorientalis brevis TaxID=1126241 RepID=A0ABD6CG52_9EURY|nr:AI-2E family transporter [Halorientalis brevis]
MVETDPTIRDVRVWAGRQHLGWWLLGLGVAAVLALVVEQYLAWLVFGLFVYYVARPVSRWLEQWLTPSLAAAATLLLLVVPVVALLAALLLVALGQLVAVLSNAPVQEILTRLPFQIPDLPNTPEEVYQTTLVLIRDPSVQSVVGSIGGVVGTVGATLYNVFIALLLAFFLLISDRPLASWFESNVFGTESLASKYLTAIDSGLRSVFFGYTMTIFAIMILTSLIYTLANVVAPGQLRIPSAVLLGVITGVFTLVPLVGRSIVYFLIAAVMGVQAATTDPRLLWYPLVFLAVMTVAFDNVVRTYIRPYLSGRDLSTGLVMFAYLFGPPMFGWYGIFLGPFLLVVIVTFVRMILPVLANPDREQPPSQTGHTLDEFYTVSDAEESAQTESERGGPEPG